MSADQALAIGTIISCMDWLYKKYSTVNTYI